MTPPCQFSNSAGARLQPGTCSVSDQPTKQSTCTVIVLELPLSLPPTARKPFGWLLALNSGSSSPVKSSRSAASSLQLVPPEIARSFDSHVRLTRSVSYSPSCATPPGTEIEFVRTVIAPITPAGPA